MFLVKVNIETKENLDKARNKLADIFNDLDNYLDDINSSDKLVISKKLTSLILSDLCDRVDDVYNLLPASYEN